MMVLSQCKHLEMDRMARLQQRPWRLQMSSGGEQILKNFFTGMMTAIDALAAPRPIDATRSLNAGAQEPHVSVRWYSSENFAI